MVAEMRGIGNRDILVQYEQVAIAYPITTLRLVYIQILKRQWQGRGEMRRTQDTAVVGEIVLTRDTRGYRGERSGTDQRVW